MKIIISGGTGLIGSNLTADLSRNNHEIVILTRSPHRAPEFSNNVNFQKWDGEHVGSWIQSLNGADVVVNLAGESIAGKGFFPSPWTEERRKRIRQSRINIGQALAQGIKEVDHKPQVFIQASAIGYYGTLKNKVVTENNPPGSDFVAKTCIEWENSTKVVEDFGVRRIVTRFGIVLSTEGGALPRLLLPFKFFVGGPMGSGEQWYSWIHMDDVCNALRYLMKQPDKNGAFNLTAPHPVKNKTFARILGKVLSRPSIFPIPGFLMRSLFGDVANVVLEGQRVVPQRLSNMDFTFQFPALEIALRDLLDRPS